MKGVEEEDKSYTCAELTVGWGWKRGTLSVWGTLGPSCHLSTHSHVLSDVTHSTEVEVDLGFAAQAAFLHLCAVHTSLLPRRRLRSPAQAGRGHG